VPTLPCDYLPEMVAGHLTGRELEVLELVSRGLTNAEIAARLNLSPWTVKRHVARLLAKAGMHRRVELAVWFNALQAEKQLAVDSQAGRDT